MLFSMDAPEWRNWQTRWTQNPVVLSTVWVRPPPSTPTLFKTTENLGNTRFMRVFYRRLCACVQACEVKIGNSGVYCIHRNSDSQGFLCSTLNEICSTSSQRN